LNIFVIDTFNDRVQIFDLNGNFDLKFGSNGTGDGQFNFPIGIFVNETNIFVADVNNNRVQIFDLSGNFVSKFGSNGTGDGQFNSPYGIFANETKAILFQSLVQTELSMDNLVLLMEYLQMKLIFLYRIQEMIEFKYLI